MGDFLQLHFYNRDEWREWLSGNNETSDGIWLVYFKKHTGKPTVTYTEAVEEALCFGWIDSKIRRIDDQQYMQFFCQRNPKSRWSLVNKKRVESLIDQGKMTERGMKMVEAARQSGNWNQAYSSQQTYSLPADLKQALDANHIAKENFSNLADSYRNNYIKWILNAKRKETRERRIRVVVERAEKNLKPGMT